MPGVKRKIIAAQARNMLLAMYDNDESDSDLSDGTCTSSDEEETDHGDEVLAANHTVSDSAESDDDTDEWRPRSTFSPVIIYKSLFISTLKPQEFQLIRLILTLLIFSNFSLMMILSTVL